MFLVAGTSAIARTPRSTHEDEHEMKKSEEEGRYAQALATCHLPLVWFVCKIMLYVSFLSLNKSIDIYR